MGRRNTGLKPRCLVFRPEGCVDPLKPPPALTVDEILEQYPSQVKRDSVTVAIGDLRNPKYAGGKPLDIVRDSDGRYRLRV